MFCLRIMKQITQKFSIFSYSMIYREFSNLLKLYQTEKPLKEIIKSNQSLSLLDTFGRKHDYLRISLTERCNLRCLYCMPEEGVTLTPKSNLLTNDEIFRMANLFVHRFGIRKIRLSGGEPLVRKDIINIVSNLSTLKQSGLEKISLTTNGILFARFSKFLREAGLDSVNISLDTLKKDRFQLTTRRNGLDKVLKSIKAALNDHYDCVKINCIPIQGVNDDEIEDFVQLTKDLNLEIRFIEYMPFYGNRWDMNKMIGFRQLLSRIKSRFELRRVAPRTINDTAILYQVVGYTGILGFINSMTNAFCSNCNRIRLTADGHLKVCLFGKDEISLKDAIRNGFDDAEICHLIQAAVRRKKKQHAGALNISKDDSNRPMILIGQRRYYSSKPSQDGGGFTHIDSNNGQVKMVNITLKQPTHRTARARARIHLGSDVLRKIEANEIEKGNVLNVAKTAVIMGAKWTSHLIPLCHQIPLDSIDVKFIFDYENEDIIIETTCQATYKTGVEMEALTATSLGALTIYDMCKSLNKTIVIRDCRLISKSGGKSNFVWKQS